MIICVTVPEICRVTNINIFHFGLFLALLPCNCVKNENFKKMKKHLEISAFNTIVPNIMITCFTLPEIRHMTEVIVIFPLGLFLPFTPPPNCPKNQNLKKI